MPRAWSQNLHSGPEAYALTAVGHALSYPSYVSTGRPMHKQPLGWGSRAFYLPPAWPALRPLWEGRCLGQLVCVGVFRWARPTLPSSLTATDATTGVFLLDFLEAGTVPFWNRCS